MSGEAQQFRDMAAQILSPTDSKGADLFRYAADAIDERDLLKSQNENSLGETQNQFNRTAHEYSELTKLKADNTQLLKEVESLRVKLVDQKPYKELLRDIDRLFGCEHVDKGPDDAQEVVRHVKELQSTLDRYRVALVEAREALEAIYAGGKAYGGAGESFGAMLSVQSIAKRGLAHITATLERKDVE